MPTLDDVLNHGISVLTIWRTEWPTTRFRVTLDEGDGRYIEVADELLKAAREPGAYGWAIRPNGELWLSPSGDWRYRDLGLRSDALGAYWERVTA